jgi:hypothetical protein
MASHEDVTAHHDASKAGPDKGANPAREHPHNKVPVRITKESAFAGPGSDAPAETQRPARDAGTDQDHPVNNDLRDDDKPLIGPQLGRGGAEVGPGSGNRNVWRCPVPE